MIVFQFKDLELSLLSSMLGTFIPKDGKLLVLANGAYGLRAAQTMDYLNRDYHLLDKGDYYLLEAMKWLVFWKMIKQ